jgi:hypothetical protein
MEHHDAYSEYALTCWQVSSLTFQLLTPFVIPTCFKQITISLLPKNTKVTCPNEMKFFERLVMAHINNIIPDTLDPLQFAYHPNRSKGEGVCLVPSWVTHDYMAAHDSL